MAAFYGEGEGEVAHADLAQAYVEQIDEPAERDAAGARPRARQRAQGFHHEPDGGVFEFLAHREAVTSFPPALKRVAQFSRGGTTEVVSSRPPHLPIGTGEGASPPPNPVVTCQRRSWPTWPRCSGTDTRFRGPRFLR